MPSTTQPTGAYIYPSTQRSFACDAIFYAHRHEQATMTCHSLALQFTGGSRAAKASSNNSFAPLCERFALAQGHKRICFWRDCSAPNIPKCKVKLAASETYLCKQLQKLFTTLLLFRTLVFILFA